MGGAGAARLWTSHLIQASPLPCRYNSVMKVIFLASAFMIIYYMRFDKVVKQTYDKDQDTFRYLFIVVPCFLLALVLHHAFTVTEVGGLARWRCKLTKGCVPGWALCVMVASLLLDGPDGVFAAVGQC